MATAFRAEQRRVAAGMAGATAVAISTIAVCMFVGWPDTRTGDAGDRLAYVLRWDIAVASVLMAAVARVAAGRFFSADDIAGAGFAAASPKVAVDRAVLQNTLEQAVLAVLTHAALAAVDAARFVPPLVLLFVAGRLSFAASYQRGAGARAFGFALTFYPTVAGLLAAAVLAVAGNPP